MVKLTQFVLYLSSIHLAELVRQSVLFDFSSKTVVDCQVAVLGAGFAGSYAAYKLSKQYKDTLCLIEKEDNVGGRVRDESAYPGGPVFGLGALRITGNHKTMHALADELDIEMDVTENENDLFKVRGDYFYQAPSTDLYELGKMCSKVFANLTCNYDGKGPDEAMVERLLELYLNSPELLAQYPDIITFVLSQFGDEGLAFIRESVAYNSLFRSISSSATFEFFVKGLEGISAHKYYPVGGMSQFIKRMLAKAYIDGVRVYKKEPVLHITTDPSEKDPTYYIETPNNIFKAQRVLSAIDPHYFRSIGGNIGDLIKSKPEFQALEPVDVAVVNAWWSKRWWEDSKFYKRLPLARIVSHENCFNMMMIPQFTSGRNQNVTRVVYDDGACVSTWKTLINSKNKALLSKEIVNSLQNVFSDVKVPTPKHLSSHVHPNGWYLQNAGSKFSNDQIFEWSQNPIGDTRFSLIGEAYNQNFAGWCDAALKSTMTILTKNYNITFPCLDDRGSPANCPVIFRSTMTEQKKRVKLSSLLP